MTDAISVYLQGGLGNQLFQFAAGWVAAARNQCSLTLNLALFNGGSTTGRRPLPDAVDLSSLAAEVHVSSWQLPVATARAATVLLWRSRHLNSSRAIVVPSGIGYDPSILDRVVPGSRLWGYFQSERFVSEARKNDFPALLPFKLPIGIPVSLLPELQDEGIVAVHVRGDDFGRVNSIQGVLPTTYYQRSLRFLETQQEISKLWIFGSDSQANRRVAMELGYPWIQASFLFDGQNSVHDYVLMRNSKTIISSNSTFSWWAAREAPNAETVTYPVPWNRHLDPIDIAPAHWTGIAS